MPPRPDIVFLADSTGSMGRSALANVSANASAIMSDIVAAQPSAQFAVGEYRDQSDAFAFQVNQDLTADTAAADAAIAGWTPGGGGDFPEAQRYALQETATGAISFRPDSTRIVVWFVVSGDDASFSETIDLAPDAAQGAVLSCTVEFLIGGEVIGTQRIRIAVNDVTAPEAGCEQGPNPDGKIPGISASPNAGQNPDGFYTLTAVDNVDDAPEVYLVDTGSGTVFGPFEPGTNVKYTQNNSEPSQKPGSGEVDWKITGNGDAAVHSVDASGNESEWVDCLVPRPPK